MNEIKTVVVTALGIIGGAIAEAFGGWGDDMITLLIFMGIDFLLGVLIAAFWHKSNKSDSGSLNSNSAWKGLIKKGVSLLVVLVAHRLDMLLGFDYIRTCVIIAFCATELISIVENLGIMGVPLPDVIVRAIEILQKKSDVTKEGDE